MTWKERAAKGEKLWISIWQGPEDHPGFSILYDTPPFEDNILTPVIDIALFASNGHICSDVWCPLLLGTDDECCEREAKRSLR